MAHTTKVAVSVTATMLDFLDSQVRRGLAIDRGEALRFIIVDAIREWEMVNHRPFPSAVFRS